MQLTIGGSGIHGYCRCFRECNGDLPPKVVAKVINLEVVSDPNAPEISPELVVACRTARDVVKSDISGIGLSLDRTTDIV